MKEDNLSTGPSAGGSEGGNRNQCFPRRLWISARLEDSDQVDRSSGLEPSRPGSQLASVWAVFLFWILFFSCTLRNEDVQTTRESSTTLHLHQNVTWDLSEITLQWSDRKVSFPELADKVRSGPEKVTSLSSLLFTMLDDSAHHHATLLQTRKSRQTHAKVRRALSPVRGSGLLYRGKDKVTFPGKVTFTLPTNYDDLYT